MNYQEILEVLKNGIGSVDDFAYMDYDSKELGLGKVQEIDQQGGEDQGSNWYSIQYFKDHDVYIKVRGYYSSYNGTDFDGWKSCSEVKPVQKMVTVYE